MREQIAPGRFSSLKKRPGPEAMQHSARSCKLCQKGLSTFKVANVLIHKSTSQENALFQCWVK